MSRIVISGSMQFLNEMKKYKRLIEKKGFTVILPEEDNWDKITPEQINNFKRIVSKRYFDIIADANTTALLVVNSDKKGVKNYIGANTFAEIAIAFYFEKKIYLLNDIYGPYSDELLAWNIIPLKGNLNLLN